MERVILGDTDLYFRQCGSKKFLAGESRPNALLLFYRGTKRFCIGETVVQFSTDAANEFTQSRLIYVISWKPVSEGRGICGSRFAGGVESKPCLYIFSRHRRESAAECGDHGYSRLPSHHSSVDPCLLYTSDAADERS